MKDAFGVERISKGANPANPAQIVGQLKLFPLKGMTRATRAKRLPYKQPKFRRSQEKQIKGQTYLSVPRGRQSGGKEFKINSSGPGRKTSNALSPEGQQKLANKLKELDRKYAGRFASQGPKVSRNDPSDTTGGQGAGARKAVNVIRLSGRQRVGKSDAFGVEVSKGVPHFPDWMHARAIAKPDSPLTRAMRQLQAGHTSPPPEIKRFRPETGIHNGDKIITTGEHSPGRYFIRNMRTGNNSTARAEDINFKINRKKPKRPKPPTQGTLF